MTDRPLLPPEVEAALDDDQRRLLALYREVGNVDPDRLGRCYELAVRQVLDLDADGVVHGTILLPNRAAATDHAWAWRDDGTVWEPTLGRWVDGGWHRWLFGTTEHHRYDRMQVHEQVHAHGHYGPWTPDGG